MARTSLSVPVFLGLARCGALALLHGIQQPIQPPIGSEAASLKAVGLVTSDLSFCDKRTRLTRRRPLPTVAPVVAAEDPWPSKGGNSHRTGGTGVKATLDLSLPHWSFYHYDVTYSTTLIDREGNVYIAPTGNTIFSLRPDGQLRWRAALNAGEPANPVLWAGALYVSDRAGFGYALDAATGKKLWQRKVADAASPGNYAVTVDHGLAIFHQDTGLGWSKNTAFIACNASNGETLWKVQVHVPFFNVMPAFADGGASLVFTDIEGGIHKHESSTGREIWSRAGWPFPLTREANWNAGAGGAPRSHSALALVADGVVYSAGNHESSKGRVRALRLETGEELWRRDFDRMMGNAAALANIDGVPTLVFGTGPTPLHPIKEAKPPFRGTFYALSAATGEELWRFEAEPFYTGLCPGSVLMPFCQRLNLPDSWSAPTIDGRGNVYVGWEGGIVYVLDGRSGRMLAQFNATEGIQSQPAIGANGELVITSGMTTHSFWPEHSSA